MKKLKMEAQATSEKICYEKTLFIFLYQQANEVKCYNYSLRNMIFCVMCVTQFFSFDVL